MPILPRPFCSLLLLSTVACAATITEKDRINARIRYDMGVASLDNGDRRGALRELLRAVRTDPTLPEAHHALALVYQGMDKLDEALEHYEKAVSLRPGFSEAYNNMGTALTQLGRFDEAIAAFQKPLGDILYPTPSLAEGNMGWAYYQRGDVDVAIQHLRNAVATNPRFCRGYEWLMRIGLAERRSQLVVTHGRRFRKICSADPEVASRISPDYLREMSYYLGLGYLETGDLQAARDTFRDCAEPNAEVEPGVEPTFGQRCHLSLTALP